VGEAGEVGEEGGAEPTAAMAGGRSERSPVVVELNAGRREATMRGRMEKSESIDEERGF